MKAVTVWETEDGVQHATQHAALRHAEGRHSDYLFRLANELVHIDKRANVAKWLAENTERLARLAELAADCEIQTEKENDE